MNYFEFFYLEPAVFIDENELYKRFIAESKKNHPDQFVQQSIDVQNLALEQSVLINQAYRTLKDFDLRLKYILGLFNLIEENEKQMPDQQFLMDMIDLNDEIMELQLNPDESGIHHLKTKLQLAQEKELNEAMSSINLFDHGDHSMSVLHQLKLLYMRKRYLWRLIENLEKIELKSQ